jgi:hypothetical protein
MRASLAIGIFLTAFPFSAVQAQTHAGAEKVSVRSVFCVERSNSVRLGRCDEHPNHQSFDVAVIEFQDNGSLADASQLKSAEDTIAAARVANRNGALVVLFIHGWHHSARWDVSKYASDWDADAGDDQHFRQFRRVLMGLAVREAERYLPSGEAGGRRVVGIYLGWNGDPTSWFGSWLSRKEHATHLSFYDRYKAAEAVGGGRAIREAIRTIVEVTKSPMQDRPESPLVLAGHSMGALVLEAAFLALLREPGDPLIKVLDPQDPSANTRSGVETTLDGRRVAFPDLLLALNSAADSGLVREILGEVERRKLTKRLVAAGVGVDYAPPLLVSVTSSADKDTAVTWRFAQGVKRIMFGAGGYDGLYTDGHDPALRTHNFTALGIGPKCEQKPGPDFGQEWHCLRFPVPRSGPTPSFAIDLPEILRHAPGGPIHRRYQLEPQFPSDRRLAWLFQVPPELVEGHNDIFNPRSSLLFMALMQISGGVMSLAEDVDRNFEAE